MDMVFEQLASIEQRVVTFRQAANGESADAAVTADLSRYDASKVVDGVDTSVSSERAKYEAGRRALYDQQLREDAAALEREAKALLEAVSTATTAYRRVPAEPNAGLHVMRELAGLQRYQGRTLATLVATYRATSDAANPTLVDLIENDRDAFRLTPDPKTDLDAMEDLQRLIEARQMARIPEDYRPALPRTRAVLPLNVRQQIEHLRSGRGIAVRPGARTLRGVA